MRALIDLRRVIRAKNTDEERAEVRPYISENIERLAVAFGVSPAALAEAVSKVSDDLELTVRMLDGIRRVLKDQRARRVDSRFEAAQIAAERVGTRAQWDEGKVHVDVPGVLDTLLTHRDDLLVFVSDAFEVAVRMAPLFELRRLRRTDLTGWVDARGLHVRWRSGGLNFCPSTNARARRVTMPIGRRGRVAA